MRFTVAAAAAALVAGVQAQTGNVSVVYTTEVHTAYTTFCPASTQITFNGMTYTATESETITITNCPCTVVKPMTTTSSVVCSTCDAVPTSAPVYSNSTTPAVASPVTPTTVAATGSMVPSPSAFTGGAAQFSTAGSLAGLFGFVAYFL